MAVYAIWNNKGGVGKSYLTFQLACEYARIHPNKKVLVIDLCPQANASSMLLGGIEKGEKNLSKIHDSQNSRKTIAGYIADRIKNPYTSPKSGASYLTQIAHYNAHIPQNLYSVIGDEKLEIQTPKILKASLPGPDDAWRSVHLWIADLIYDIKTSWNNPEICVFIDCNPSFSIYTELALTAAERLIIPFSADGSSKRAIKAVLSLVYGSRRYETDEQSDFFLKTQEWRMQRPQIYMYVGNRLTQMNKSPASAFKTIVHEIGQEIWQVWQKDVSHFCIHPDGSPTPNSKKSFEKMFQYEVNDANTASVVSAALGIPMSILTDGFKMVAGKRSKVNQSQLDKQVPNIQKLAQSIE